ncbi:potassium/proton antiporter [Rhizobium sp. KVB221]|uniref:Potassium/proton antiporter n=1 Tax=Rhizobium setariae TaxID=2801340 RepID=A0A936YK41_9HYPH|nr:potassium/proton antiporter [Rhizobium setariae]MBL0371683.1 potassium/proton antiporter [Rhizobium setariae]
MDSFYLILLVFSSLILLAAFSSLLAFRFGAPLLLLFLSVGLIAGIDGLGIDFDDNNAAYKLGSVALAVILFDSGFGTHIKAFKVAALPAMTLATIGVLITASLFAFAATWLLDFSLLEGLLLGSIVASTDAAAVFFLLRISGINIRDQLTSTLEVESGTNDPMAIFLTVTLVGLVTAGKGLSGFDGGVLFSFVKEMGIGLVFGLIGGWLIVAAANRFDQDRGLTPILVLALALLVFAITGTVHGSGFLAVYVAGLVAGNRELQQKLAIKRFQDGMTWLAQIVMFVMLGLLATPSQFDVIIIPAIALGLFLIFIARPLAIWLCLLPFDFAQNEIKFIAWVGLRGAVSILLSILPILSGIPTGQTYFNITFIIVLVSLLLQGWTIKPVAKRLGLLIPKQTGEVDRLEIDLPRAANHELVSYRVIPDSPVVKGARIPRWATPSLVIRDGRSLRYQYAGRLRENDLVYVFVTPTFIHLLDRLFANRAELDAEDEEFFGTFAISPARPARELDAAYGPGLLLETEKGMSVGDMMLARLGGKADYADRVRFGSLILIVRDIDDNNHISSVGVSMEAVEPPKTLPVFLNIREISERIRNRFTRA